MIRLILLVAVVLVAFAANSILNRMALAGGEAGPAGFAAVRVASGALALVVMARLSGQSMTLWSLRRAKAAGALLLYLLGFSFAYLTLDAGIGALILFGGVQVTMFAGALLAGERPTAMRWVGMGIGFAGLVWLLAPGGAGNVSPAGAVLMTAAAIGWGIYSLIGRGAIAPLGDTAGSFLLAAPFAIVAWAVSGEGVDLTAAGWALAVISGVITSGMGYALWYAVLPKLEAAVAGLAQLLVPVIAVIGGALLLGEVVSVETVASAALVLFGVALGIVSGRGVPAGRR